MMTQTEIPALTAREVAYQLAYAIRGKRQQRLEARANEPPWKPRRHYASNLNGCARQLVYAMTRYQEREPFSPKAVAAMEDGVHEERLVIQELLADGFDVVEQQVQLDDDRYFITGKIDGKIRWQGRRVPFEIKRLSGFAFDKIQTIEDIKADPFLLKKLRQLTLYLYLHSEEAGLFIFSDGCGGRKELDVPLDFELAESILKDLDAANDTLRRIKAGTSESDALPERIPYHSKVCGWCSFRRTCLPDVDFGQGAVLGTEELAKALARLEEVKPQANEAEQLRKEVKRAVEGKSLVIAGRYVVSGEWRERKMSAQPARVDRYWAWEAEKKEPVDGQVGDV